MECIKWCLNMRKCLICNKRTVNEPVLVELCSKGCLHKLKMILSYLEKNQAYKQFILNEKRGDKNGV